LHSSFLGANGVSEGFNSYREWLGLGVRAPNYYELLGLPLQESDEGRIAAAAERAMTRVRSFRPGPLARDWAQLLDEIRAAKDCLLDADRRAQYDAMLSAAASSEVILPPGCSPSELEATATPERAANASNDMYPPMPGRPTVPVPAAVIPTTLVGTPILPEAVTPELPEASASASWAAGPSPIYGLPGDGQIPSTPTPAAAPLPIPTRLDALPMAMPVSQQPVVPATFGAPQRATFRAATNMPQKSNSRSSGRSFAWGTAAAIVLLGLIAAGLTYRLSVVARQQKLADAEAAAAAAKRAATEPPVTKRRPAATVSKPDDEPTAELPAVVPDASQKPDDSRPTNNAAEPSANSVMATAAPQPR